MSGACGWRMCRRRLDFTWLKLLEKRLAPVLSNLKRQVLESWSAWGAVLSEYLAGVVGARVSARSVSHGGSIPVVSREVPYCHAQRLEKALVLEGLGARAMAPDQAGQLHTIFDFNPAFSNQFFTMKRGASL